MSEKHCQGATKSGKLCTCMLTREELKEGGIAIFGICLTCDHAYGEHPSREASGPPAPTAVLPPELSLQMRSMSLKPKTICSIHCWQHMKFSEIFEFEQDMVSIDSFLRWTKAKFSGVISFSHGCAVKVYYLSHLESWADRTKIDTNEALRSYLMQVSSDRSLQSYIMISIEQESPLKPPHDDIASTKHSSLTNHSRGSVQKNFHQRVLTRDGGCCVFCADSLKANLVAAHIFDVFRATDIPGEDTNFLLQYEILDLYDTSNGITLCMECHEVFDALLCCVKVEFDSKHVVISHKIVVANALTSSAEFVDKWSRLDGASVRVPTMPALLKHWPPVELFQFREAKYEEYAVKRRQLAQDLPNVCKCGKRTKSIAGLASHMRSKSCLESMTTKSNKFSKLFTPVKTSAVKKQQSKRKKPKSAGMANFSPEPK